jgi:hypothetical protein
MEAQVCKILMEHCNTLLRDRYIHCVAQSHNGNVTVLSYPDSEPWLLINYSNAYMQTLKEAVLLLRRLYSFW